MISEEVRSTKGRPRASTPVAMRGTACTIRVLRRFLNSVLVLTAPRTPFQLPHRQNCRLNRSYKPPPSLSLLRFFTSAWQQCHCLVAVPTEYVPRPACGVLRSKTSKLLLRPRWALPANKSVLGKTPDGFLQCGGREKETPIRRQKIPRPKSIS